MTSAPRRGRLIPAEPVLRRLAAMNLVNTFGSGLFMTLGALYFTRIVGLSVAQVGLVLTVAGGVGVLAGVPFGHAADRLGVRGVLIALLLAEAAGTASYALVGSFPAFLLVAVVTTTFDRASNAVRNGLYAVALPPQTRTQGRAYLRAVTNVGIGTGAALAAVALQADTKTAYALLILLDSLTFVIATAILLLLPVRTGPAVAVPTAPTPRSRALRDGPYLAITGLNSVLALQFGLLEVGLPLWIAGHTHAPRVMVALTLLLNTVLVVLMQVRASRGVTDVASAARAAARGGLLMAGSCLLLAGAHGVPAWTAVVLLLAGIVIQTLSEVSCSAAGWAMSYDLADPAQPSAYQGVYQSGFALAAMLAPLIVTSTALRFGFVGWCLLAALFAAAGLALTPVSAWAASRRAVHTLEPATESA